LSLFLSHYSSRTSQPQKKKGKSIILITPIAHILELPDELPRAHIKQERSGGKAKAPSKKEKKKALKNCCGG
jgi:hypothetical protein